MSHSLRLKLIPALLIVAPLLFGGSLVRAQSTGTITGSLTDADNGETLPGATAELRRADLNETYRSAIADGDGHYELENVEAGPYMLIFRMVGYETHQAEIQMGEGETLVFNVALRSQPFYLDEVMVTGEPAPVKRLESTSATSVVEAREIEREVVPSPTDVLRRVPGLDLARTGVDRREIVLRGFGHTFSGATYVMTDYRQSAIASLGVNAYNMMPLSSIDLERIEVVRGPAGAVYGPGVDEGAVHFVSKDPFRHPGTTIAVSGGERSMLQGQLRHAGVIKERFGYKINAQYLRAEEWELDESDPHDIELSQRFYTQIPMDREIRKVILNATAVYRFDDQKALTAVAGYGSAKSPFLSDIGPLQSDGFGYRFGQLRYNAGRFFAQAYLNSNDAGNSFIYAGPEVPPSLSGEAVVDNSTQLNLQAQHGLTFARDREQITFGVDYERTNPATDATINGRNENDDLILEYGAYAQSLTQISEQLRLTLAARLDYDNVFEQMQVSPRAAIVYMPDPEHAVRATYNRAFSSPSTNSLFLDILAATSPLPVRARGAAHGFTFEHNAAYLVFAESDLVASSLNPATRGQPQPVGLPLDPIYGSIYDELSQIPPPVLQQILCDLGLCISEQEVAFIQSELSPNQTPVVGFTDGSLGIPNLNRGGVDPVSSAPDISPLKQSTTQSFELGYKGLFANRILVSVDAYYTVKENFQRGLQVESPLVFVPQLSPDLQTAIRDGIVNNEDLYAALQQRGIPPEVVASLMVQLAGEGLPGPDVPVAVVQPSENNPGVGQMPELLMTYRNFGSVALYGLEAAVNVEVDERTSLYGSFSWVSDDFFDNEELDESNEDLFVSLNAPTFKAGAGVAYASERGFSFNLAGRYIQGFIVRSGPYNGFVDDYFLLDAGAGYDFGNFAPGLRLDVTVQNVLDHMHREFVGAPKMGRLGLAQFTYTF